MNKILLSSVLFLIFGVSNIYAADAPVAAPINATPAVAAEELSKFIYSYGTVLKVSAIEIVVQEYDYDSDVEKEVTYQIDPAIQLQGFKAVADLVPDDVIEIYYIDQDNKKIAKILRKEVVEDEALTSGNTPEGGN